MVAGGVAVDDWLNTAPIFTLIGVALALLSAGYQLYELAELGHRGHRPGPVTRAIARLPARPTQDSRPTNDLDGQTDDKGYEE
jgi:hypothetical protein